MFKARKFGMGFLGGVNFWSRDLLGFLLDARGIFLGFAFCPPFDHPLHFKFRVPPPLGN